MVWQRCRDTFITMIGDGETRILQLPQFFLGDDVVGRIERITLNTFQIGKYPFIDFCLVNGMN
ncbi:hypothetical protein AOU00_10675 [Paenibacillus polymyxa]|nr:hypothetical protein AOU00_10675 [Paenibacillus polymyxa]